MARYILLMPLGFVLLTPMASWAASVTLAGILGSKALLVVNGGAPRAVAVGELHQGVKVLAVQREEVAIDVDGVRQNLRLGESPVSVGQHSGNKRIVLSADRNGHFVSAGTINGKSMQYMVDTGASAISIGKPDADRMGIQYQNGQRINMHTANGVSSGWLVKLNSVRIGDIEIVGVQAIVTPERMPYVLLGNNLLGEFQMTRNSQQMILEKR
jgi:aspartyl protease family protein